MGQIHEEQLVAYCQPTLVRLSENYFKLLTLSLLTSETVEGRILYSELGEGSTGEPGFPMGALASLVSI